MASRTSTPLTHPEVDRFDLFQVMHALSDPTRLGIVIALTDYPGLTCNGFYRDVTPSVLTRHFRVLRESGVIRQKDVGNRRINTLRKDELDQRFPGLLDMAIAEGADRATPFTGIGED